MLNFKRNTSRIMVVLAAIALAFMATVPAAGAKPKPKPKPKVSVTISDARQNPMVYRGYLKVKVRAAKKGRIRVRAYSATFERNGQFRPLTRFARPKFRRAGQWKVVKLRLTVAGKAEALSCQDRDLRVNAGPVKSRTRSMRRTTRDCRPQPVDLS